MSKLSKLLDSKAELITTSLSGSTYYRVGNKKIRVADHLTVMHNQFALNIFTPKNSATQYVVAINNSIHIYQNFTELKAFLIPWCLIMQTQFEIIIPNVDSKINTLEKEIFKLKSVINKLEQKKKSSKIEIGSYDLLDFTNGQQIQIKSFIRDQQLNKKIKNAK